MPTYEFKCPKCPTTRTIERSIKDDRPVKCPFAHECGSEKMDRLIPTTTSFKLKGSSWAKDGYR